jgi:hypothetical protein
LRKLQEPIQKNSLEHWNAFFKFSTLLFCLSLVALVSFKPAFGPIDDHILTLSLLMGKPLPLFIQPSIGRFYPLNMQDWQVLSQLFTPDAQTFYTVIALQMCIFLSTLAHILKRISKSWIFVFASLFTLCASPGFAHTWYRLGVPERNIALLFLLSVCPIIRFLEAPDVTLSRISLGFGLGASALALFFKEPVFVLIGAFCLTILFQFNKNGPKYISRYAWLNLFLCLGFLCVYFYFIKSNPAQSDFIRQKRSSYGFLTNSLRVYGGFVLCNPLTAVMGPLLGIWRVVSFVKTNSWLKGDSFLAAGLGYLLVYLTLGIYTPYYLWPADLSLMLGFAFYFDELHTLNSPTPFKSHVFRLCFFTTAFLVILSAVPLGINGLVFNAFLPDNFQQTVGFIKQKVEGNPRDRKFPTYIALFGVDPETNQEPYLSFQRFLTFQGIQNTDFKIEPYSEKSTELQNYLVIVPTATQSFDSRTLDHLRSQGWQLEFSTHSMHIPNLSLQRVAKWLFRKFSQGQPTVGNGKSSSIVYTGTENDARNPNYFVLKKKAP